jgi:hypothetical protein
MTMQKAWLPKRATFELPMTATVTLCQDPAGNTVAHALDFDLVAVSDTVEKAVEKLCLAVKIYIEYGLSNGWTDDIVFKAPPRFWEAISQETQAKFLPSIMIDASPLFVLGAIMSHASSSASCEA